MLRVTTIHSWDKMSYSVHEHDFESPWLLDVCRGNSHVSRDVGIWNLFCLYPAKVKIESMEEY